MRFLSSFKEIRKKIKEILVEKSLINVLKTLIYSIKHVHLILLLNH